MKITISQTSLNKLISKVIAGANAKSNTPILQNIKIEAKENELYLSSTDFDTYITTKSACQIEEEGVTTVPAHVFFDLVKKLSSNSDIKIIQDSPETLSVRCGRSKYKLPCLSADEFPGLPEGQFVESFNIDSKSLISAIDGASFAISNDETKYYLNGLCIKSENREGSFIVNAMATDGHRLAVSSIQDANVNSEFSIIIPKKSVAEIKKISNNYKESEIFISKTLIKIVSGDLIYTSKLIDGEFPDCSKVIPKDNNQLAVADKNLLFNCVDRISISATDKSKSIKFTIDKDKIILESTTGYEELDIDYSGDLIKLGFNSRYLLDIINQVNSNDINIFLKDSNSPILVKSNKSQFVLMPTRI